MNTLRISRIVYALNVNNVDNADVASVRVHYLNDCASYITRNLFQKQLQLSKAIFYDR